MVEDVALRGAEPHVVLFLCSGHGGVGWAWGSNDMAGVSAQGERQGRALNCLIYVFLVPALGNLQVLALSLVVCGLYQGWM